MLFESNKSFFGEPRLATISGAFIPILISAHFELGAPIKMLIATTEVARMAAYIGGRFISLPNVPDEPRPRPEGKTAENAPCGSLALATGWAPWFGVIFRFPFPTIIGGAAGGVIGWGIGMIIWEIFGLK